MRTIHIAGDSTASIKDMSARPETGWGEAFGNFFQPAIQINNHAKNGRSSKSFIEEGRLARLKKEFQTGDFLLIQFGHNDQKITEAKGTEPFGSYLDALSTYAQTALASHVQPIFLTPVTRRLYLKNGQLDPNCLGEYPQAMKQFAQKNNFPILDVFTRSQTTLQQYTQEETKSFYLHLSPGRHGNYPSGLCDNTHFSPEGAALVAQLVVELLKETDLPLVQYLNVPHK
ncbi:rhamnogalacturonan acetylesterase [Enterococcus sp. DIV1298c]|uniref:rhamnogalacturonan acetylesterase n=1 Tax=Enterococcus sp. DIV1298c TaxID=2815328 RepID=UPI001A92B516|nr:rhamnogalacturonan acetylesterase [Enterococcus sp. DIV1298c]MBO0460885.1 rhamnogalacturonan acetylesterase [Enterococcus sp. DIV1298c]